MLSIRKIIVDLFPAAIRTSLGIIHVNRNSQKAEGGKNGERAGMKKYFHIISSEFIAFLNLFPSAHSRRHKIFPLLVNKF